MTNSNTPRQTKAISEQFSARLDRLAPNETIRAIVLLATPQSGTTSGRRQDAAQREAAVVAVRAAAEEGSRKIDEILQRVGGRRLRSGVDALGAVPVETTAAGIRMLGAAAWAKAVLEDQQIHPGG